MEEHGFVMDSEDIEKVNECEIIKKVFEACPQIIFLPHLLYLDGWGRHTNTAIVQLLNCYEPFEAIIQKHFVKVCSNGGFEYDYGDISSTHDVLDIVGYARRDKHTIPYITYPWD